MGVRFLNNAEPPYELTYNDVFLVPSLAEQNSRLDVSLTPRDNTPCTIPIVAANMTAVSGKRMAETLARRGAMAVIPQDIPVGIVDEVVHQVKKAHTVFETPITMEPQDTVGDIEHLLGKRAHGAAVIVSNGEPVGVVTRSQIAGVDRFTQARDIMSTDVLELADNTSLKDIFNALHENHNNLALINSPTGQLMGIMSEKSTIRSTLYKPALDKKGRLAIAAAIGISVDPAGRALALREAGVDTLVIDTAHGHQKRMLRVIREVREMVGPDMPIVAGNIVSTEGTKDLIEAGADIVKVGVGPGAMCTTRMMTGVGRPQFSAVLECAKAAKDMGKWIWADGGVRHPRDVALALAAGASQVMIGSWFAGTNESPGDIQVMPDGTAFKLSFGMASNRAVKHRTAEDEPFVRARKAMFEEGISSGRMPIDPDNAGVEDLIDSITAGVRSACTYAGASNLEEFARNAVVGVQSGAGFAEGKPINNGW